MAFGDGPRNFEPWSSDEDDTWAGTSFPNYNTTPTGGRLSSRQFQRASLPYPAVFSGTVLELKTSQTQSDTLTTRLPGPRHMINIIMCFQLN
ncbi:hypothetical protein TNCV_4464751 [Trichonephila clavipes]|nr:hypothetical protein TNCV_4464751 [Trichonephila clavipes]